VTQFLHDELNKVYADPELQQKLAVLGLEPEWMSSAELSQRIKSDTAKWAELIKATNIKAD
jgi:tripartite-type tricarboxylate transporter receptor subunit TctC